MLNLIQSIDDTQDFHTRLCAYLEKSYREGSNSTRGRVSRFWSTVLQDRPQLLNFNELLVFRKILKRGLGCREVGDLADAQRRQGQMLQMVKQFVPSEYIMSIKEPLFGSPDAFAHDEGVS